MADVSKNSDLAVPDHIASSREKTNFRYLRSNSVLRPKKLTREDVLAEAKAILLSGKMLDMLALASELGVGRSTLYRWVGNREQLINEVLMMLLQETFAWVDDKLAKEKAEGTELIIRWAQYIMRTVNHSTPITSILRNEPDVALRILTGIHTGSLKRTSIEKLAGMIEQEREKGTYQPRIEPIRLADIILRLTDSLVYGDMIAGIEVDHDEASKMIRSVL